MAVQEAEAPYQGHLEGLVVADVRLATQTEGRRRDQMMGRNQAGEVVHQVSLHKLMHDGDRKVPRVGNSPRCRVASG